MQEFLRPEHRGGLTDLRREIVEFPRYGLVERHDVAGEIPAEIEILIEAIEFVKYVFRKCRGNHSACVIHGEILSEPRKSSTGKR